MAVAAIIGGGVVAAAGAIYGAYSDYQNDKAQAKHKQEMIIYNRDTARDTMEKELAIAREEDEYQAGVLNRQADWAEGQNAQQAGLAMQGTYITSLGYNKEITDRMAQNEQEGGAITARAAMSGIRNTGSAALVRDITDQNNAQDVAHAQMTAEAATEGAVASNIAQYEGALENLAVTRQQADRRVARYNEGSDFMDLYYYRRERITGEASLQTTYLDDMIDRSYWNNLIGGAFDAAGAGLGIYKTGLNYNLWGPNKPTKSGASSSSSTIGTGTTYAPAWG